MTLHTTPSTTLRPRGRHAAQSSTTRKLIEMLRAGDPGTGRHRASATHPLDEALGRVRRFRLADDTGPIPTGV